MEKEMINKLYTEENNTDRLLYVCLHYSHTTNIAACKFVFEKMHDYIRGVGEVMKIKNMKGFMEKVFVGICKELQGWNYKYMPAEEYLKIYIKQIASLCMIEERQENMQESAG